MISPVWHNLFCCKTDCSSWLQLLKSWQWGSWSHMAGWLWGPVWVQDNHLWEGWLLFSSISALIQLIAGLHTHCCREKGHEKGDRQGKEKLRARLFFLAPVLVYARSWWCGTKVSEFTEDPYKAKWMFSKDCWGQIEEENDGNWF